MRGCDPAEGAVTMSERLTIWRFPAAWGVVVALMIFAAYGALRCSGVVFCRCPARVAVMRPWVSSFLERSESVDRRSHASCPR